ncbi:MAG: tetratricopeptide repeat protein [Deltaproteobacteria bacterium]|nr:tetratricopeptide repeat protein [Deltaproteobacteria bacterium]
MAKIQSKSIEPVDIFEDYGFIAAVLLIPVISFVIYSNTFSSPFQFDDYLYVISYNKNHPLSSFWPPTGSRYFTYLTFALNYSFGGLGTFGYHLVNVLIHSLNGIGVYLLVRETSKTPLLEGSGIPAGSIALLSSVIFTAHPVQTEAITYVTQRFASLATLFYIFSLLAFIRWRRSAEGAPKRILFYAAALVLAVIAQKTKEITFTLPFMMLFFELVFFKGGSIGKRVLRLVPFLLTLLIIPLTMYGLDAFLWGGEGAIGDEVRNLQLRDLHNISRHDYLITQFRVVVTYLRLLVLPVNQNLDYDYPMFRTFFDPEVVASFVFLLLFFSLGSYLIWRALKKNGGYGALAGFGIIWFFVTISIESSIIPIKDIIFEHRLYLPSPGMAIAFSSFALFLAGLFKARFGLKASSSAVTIALLLVTAAPLGAASYVRNKVWVNEIRLFEDIVRKSPKKERVRYNLAWVYQVRGKKEKAIEQYKESIKLEPNKDKSHYNAALIYQSMNDNVNAIAHFKEAVRISPKNAVAYYNMAASYVEMGDRPAAIECYKEAIRINPGYEDAQYNIGWMYKEAGDLKKAEAHFLAASALNPANADARYNLGLIYRKLGMRDRAIDEFAAVLRIDPAYAAAETELNKIKSRPR